MEQLTILLLGFHVEKCTWLWQDDVWTFQKSEKGEETETHEVLRGFTFRLIVLFFFLGRITAQMYQSHW